MNRLENNILSFFQGIIFWKYQLYNKLFIPLSPTSNFDLVTNFERLFSDLVYAQKFFKPSDFTQFKLFIQDIRKGNNNQTLIKLLDLKGKVHWIKSGAYYDSKTKITYGYVYDLTNDLNKFFDKKNRHFIPPASINTNENSDKENSFHHSIFTQNVQKQIKELNDMSEVLKIMQNNQSILAPFDLIILLHINKRKRTVKFFLSDSKLQQQISKSNIPYSNLLKTLMDGNESSFFIIEDLLLSDSLLDWAIFIPLGLKSYYAHPISYNRQLQGVLYFGSFIQSFFTPIHNPNYHPYINTFRKKYQVWRKNN